MTDGETDDGKQVIRKAHQALDIVRKIIKEIPS
jgi:hypothetical protein